MMKPAAGGSGLLHARGSENAGKSRRFTGAVGSAIHDISGRIGKTTVVALLQFVRWWMSCSEFMFSVNESATHASINVLNMLLGSLEL